MDSDDNNDDVILDANNTDEVHQDDNDNNACQPIVNGLLTFTISLVHNSTDVKITELLVKHFDGTEIKDAKCMLCDVAKVDYQIRQDSINRSEKVAHVRDIIERLRKLDKDNKLPLFVIDAVGLAKLPKINAEDICYVSVAEKIAQLSSKLDVLNDVVANNSVRSVKNEHDIQSMEKNYSKHVTNVSSNSNSALSMKCDADGISHMKKGPNSAPPGSTQGPHQGSDMGPITGSAATGSNTRSAYGPTSESNTWSASGSNTRFASGSTSWSNTGRSASGSNAWSTSRVTSHESRDAYWI